uniref:Uncharacterized protein n=1 Tax=Ascaris lumbricoides TaxID=6252 RepID=A0A0M3HKI9_ASCLU
MSGVIFNYYVERYSYFGSKLVYFFCRYNFFFINKFFPYLEAFVLIHIRMKNAIILIIL